MFLSFSARTAQRQCCLGSLKESHCFSGMNAAREGTVCEVDNNDQCGADSYKVKVLPMVLLIGCCMVMLHQSCGFDSHIGHITYSE